MKTVRVGRLGIYFGATKANWTPRVWAGHSGRTRMAWCGPVFICWFGEV